MINVIIIDKDKNTIVIDLWDEQYKQLFQNKVVIPKVKRHKTMSELDKEVRKYLKEVNRKEEK